MFVWIIKIKLNYTHTTAKFNNSAGTSWLFVFCFCLLLILLLTRWFAELKRRPTYATTETIKLDNEVI